MMDLDELQSVQSRERQKDSLQQLRESFYREAGEFIAQLRRERERAADQADDPWNAPEVSRLSDDIDTAEDTVEAIYERRVGKIVKMASLAAADMTTDDEGLTAEERDLFETLVDTIEHNRLRVEAVLDGEDPASVAADEAASEHSSAGPAADEAPSRADEAPSRADEAPSRADEAPSRADETPPESDPAHQSESPGEATDTAPADSGTVDAADLMGSGVESGSETRRDDDSVPASDPPTGPEAGSEADPTTESKGASNGESTDSAPEPTTNATREPPAEAPPEPPADLQTESAPSDSDPETESGEPSTAGVEGQPSAAGSGGDGETQRIGGQPETQQVERETVRITNDVGEIFGVDERRYDLTADDVVTLPADNAKPLVERDAAERLD